MMYRVIWIDIFKPIKREKVDYSTALQILINEGVEESIAALWLGRMNSPFEMVTEEGYILKVKKAQ